MMDKTLDKQSADMDKTLDRLRAKQYSRIKQMNKYNIDFFYMHLFTMRSQCVLNRSSNQDAHYSCPR